MGESEEGGQVEALIPIVGKAQCSSRGLRLFRNALEIGGVRFWAIGFTSCRLNCLFTDKFHRHRNDTR
jgi:hypothetical protein